MKNPNFRINNFDLIRLFAATQVVLIHVVMIMDFDPGVFIEKMIQVLHLFPGVPVFFFISGFLISKSYENNHRLAEYAQNRFLRLYPALIACVTLSFIFIYVSGYMEQAGADATSWLALFLAKISFLQFYNPDFMRGYGDGVLNGSLWTITVELQFYILIPILYWMFSLHSSKGSNLRIILLIVFFLLLNRVYTYMPTEYKDEIWYKLLKVSFIPWIYMFLVGVFFQRNFDFIYKLVDGAFLKIIVVYLALGYLVKHFELSLGNNINPAYFLLLTVAIFSFAYTAPTLARKILRGNDMSYGVYIYHMPVINLFLFKGFEGSWKAGIAAFLLTFLIAYISWVFIERKSLTLKKHPLNPLYQGRS